MGAGTGTDVQRLWGGPGYGGPGRLNAEDRSYGKAVKGDRSALPQDRTRGGSGILEKVTSRDILLLFDIFPLVTSAVTG